MNTIKEFHDSILNCQPINLKDYKEIISELLPLETCLQDPAWHGELDVLSHTNMVMQETLAQMENFRQGFPRVALYIAALLHDVGKPETAKPKKNGYNSFHGHEKAGVWIAREFLKKYFPEFNFRQRELILNLVEYHGHPKRITEGHSHDARFKRLSLEVPTHFVHHLEIADFNGRIANDKEKALVVLDEFKKKCEELNIYGSTYQIPNSKYLSNLQYSIFRWNILMHKKDETDQREIERVIKLTNKSSPFDFTLLVGPPGSGKTTYRNQLSNMKIISMDEERNKLCGTPNDMSRNQEVFNNCFKEFNNSLRMGENVCWDACAVTRKARKTLLEAARHHGAQITIVGFDWPISVLLERNAARDKKVPDEIVWKFFKELEFPASYEYEKLVIIDGTTRS